MEGFRGEHMGRRMGRCRGRRTGRRMGRRTGRHMGRCTGRRMGRRMGCRTGRRMGRRRGRRMGRRMGCRTGRRTGRRRGRRTGRRTGRRALGAGQDMRRPQAGSEARSSCGGAVGSEQARLPRLVRRERRPLRLSEEGGALMRFGASDTHISMWRQGFRYDKECGKMVLDLKTE